jgi:hypothetical protein
MSVSLDPGPSSPQQSVSADAENAPAAPRQDSFAATPAAPWPQLDMKTVEPLFNLAVIVASVAFVVNLLVTIDADVWRGWTWEEVLLRVPGDSWAAYESTLEMEPLMTKVELNTLIYALGDFIAQAVEGGGVSLNFSLTRMARNALIGFCLGFFAHYYYELGEMLLPSENRMLMPLKIGIDQTFYASLWNSLYFAALGLLKGKSPEWIATDVKSKFWPLLKVCARARPLRPSAASPGGRLARAPPLARVRPGLEIRAEDERFVFATLDFRVTTLLFTPRSLRRLGPGRAANTPLPDVHPASPNALPRGSSRPCPLTESIPRSRSRSLVFARAGPRDSNARRRVGSCGRSRTLSRTA